MMLTRVNGMPILANSQKAMDDLKRALYIVTIDLLSQSSQKTLSNRAERIGGGVEAKAA